MAGELVATAARGIEEEVREGVRIPFGSGFAGRIAASRGPIRLDRVDATTVANPILWEKGIKVMLGVPLLAADRVLGVIHVGRLEHRPFTDHDVALLQVVADRVAGAIQSRSLAVERAAAALLERSLLPERLPSPRPRTRGAVRAGRRRRSSAATGTTCSHSRREQLWIVVGDVAGHGIEASIVMGRIRSALRAVHAARLPVDEVLRLVDRKVEHFEIGTIATVACAVSDPPYDTMTIAVAGHPPPVIAAPNHAADGHERRSGSAARLRAEQPILVETSLSTPRRPQSSLYTDGLVERRGRTDRRRHRTPPGGDLTRAPPPDDGRPHAPTRRQDHPALRRHRSRRAPKNRYPQTQTRRRTGRENCCTALQESQAALEASGR